jgi:hypothetical protein
MRNWKNAPLCLEDIEAIKQLNGALSAMCDNDHNPDMITPLFAEDGIWERRCESASRHAASSSPTSRSSSAPETCGRLVACPSDEIDYR